MRLFLYYVLHSFKNQLKKLLKTWVLIFILVCALFGGVIGFIAGTVGSSLEGQEETTQPGWIEGSPEEEIIPEGLEEEEFVEDMEEDSFFQTTGVEPYDIAELAAGGIVLVLFLFMAFGADKNGSKIFVPADVNLLFASPMKPQSVLLFRLSTQLGVALLASFYLLFQIPNLTMNLGLGLGAAFAVIMTWCFTLLLATLLQVLLYVLASTYPAVKRLLRPVIYGLLAAVLAGYFLVLRQSGAGYLKAAILFFNAKATRFIPVWGWLKGFCMFAIEGNLEGTVLSLIGIILCGGMLVYVIWHIHADFYEDAMARSEEIAEIMEKAQSEKSSGIVVKRKKDRSEKLKRDGLNYGSGANVFFFKTLYNRFRFAQFGFFTKTMEFYLAVAVGVGLICRLIVHTSSVIPLVLTMAALVFYRSLGNPLNQDTSMDYFVMIPESLHAKLFWSLMGGTVNCLLDVLVPLIVGAVLTGASPFGALLWIPFLVSVDFYATSVGTFIDLSVPVNAGKIVKQIVQIMFIYFGLLPDIGILAVGFIAGNLSVGVIASAVFHIGLGFLFFGLSPLFLEPRSTKPQKQLSEFKGDFHAARKQFSQLGMGIFGIFVLTSALQMVVIGVLNYVYPDGNVPMKLFWLSTFLPMYVAGVPFGLALISRVPAAPAEKHRLKPGEVIVSAVICIFVMYAGNIVGNLVNFLLQSLLGVESANPLLYYITEDTLWMRVLVMVVLAPLIEEYIFRKQLIDRMNVYGGKVAVVTSAIMFGLFHGNLSQLFYAAGLGLVFGYIYLKTGRLRYSVGLHMFVNFMGSVVTPELINRIGYSGSEHLDMARPETMAGLFSPWILAFGAYILLIIVLFFAGLVLFCIKSRSVCFEETDLELPRGTRLKTVCLNVGMILLLISCAASIVVSVIG